MTNPDSGMIPGIGEKGDKKRTGAEKVSSGGGGGNRSGTGKKHASHKKRSPAARKGSGKRRRNVSRARKSIFSRPFPYLLIGIVLAAFMLFFIIESEKTAAGSAAQGSQAQNANQAGAQGSQAQNANQAGAQGSQAQNANQAGGPEASALTSAGQGDVQATGTMAGAAVNAGAGNIPADNTAALAAAGQGDVQAANLSQAPSSSEAENSISGADSETGESGDAVPVRSITISAETDEMVQCDTLQLTAEVSPGKARNTSLLWYSDDETIARVSQTGVVTSVGGGSTVINVIASNGVTAAFPIHVSASSKIMNVTVDVECTHNDKAGFNWTYKYMLDGEPIHESRTLVVEAGRTISLVSEIMDHDAQPDIGSCSGSYVVDESSLSDGFDITQEVVVTENEGNLAGNTASFIVTYHFTGVLE